MSKQTAEQYLLEKRKAAAVAAFPRPESVCEGDAGYPAQEGMTLRDYFASAAMRGWLASYGPNSLHPGAGERAAQEVAHLSYAVADAMLAERMKAEE